MEGLTMNGYQDAAMSTCMRTCDNFSYMMLNLIGEVGELASKVAKDIRRNEVKIGGTMCDNDLIPLTDEDVWWNRQDEYMASVQAQMQTKTTMAHTY